jgi:REP element-mobilizing transposase RayT
MSIIAPGYLLTWHTYGTWLHGDEAGSVDRLHNLFGTPRHEPDSDRFKLARTAMVAEPIVLSRTSRLLVDAVMRDHCRLREADLRALSVRSNHVHVVVSSPTIPPEPIVKQLKEWGTRKLRSHRIIGPQQKAWAAHASTIYLFEPGSLEKAIHYVLTMQDDPPEGHGRADWDTKLGF